LEDFLLAIVRDVLIVVVEPVTAVENRLIRRIAQTLTRRKLVFGVVDLVVAEFAPGRALHFLITATFSLLFILLFGA